MTTSLRITPVRTLAAALLAVVAVGVSIGHADAKPRNPNDGPHCSLAKDGVGWARYDLDPSDDENVAFYLPGQRGYVLKIGEEPGDVHMYTLECLQNGTWRVAASR